MAPDDLPMISDATDSTRIDLPAKPVAKPVAKPAAPPVPAPAKPAVGTARVAPVSAPAAQDPRKASELRRAQGAPAPAVRPPAPPPLSPRDDEDPEKLLREYADRQKTKVTRLEGELVELRKAAAEREQYRVKWEMAARDLQDARAKLEAASKLDAVIKDLQGKVDAAILSNGMLTDENGKLKAKVQELAGTAKKLEEKAAHAEKVLADASRALTAETAARREAEARIAAAAQALQPRTPAAPPKK
jgi:hypothetical protein